MKYNQSSISTDTVETTDLVELIRNGPAGQSQPPEQEVYFDAGYMPPPHTNGRYVRRSGLTGSRITFIVSMQ